MELFNIYFISAFDKFMHIFRSIIGDNLYLTIAATTLGMIVPPFSKKAYKKFSPTIYFLKYYLDKNYREKCRLVYGPPRFFGFKPLYMYAWAPPGGLIRFYLRVQNRGRRIRVSAKNINTGVYFDGFLEQIEDRCFYVCLQKNNNENIHIYLFTGVDKIPLYGACLFFDLEKKIGASHCMILSEETTADDEQQIMKKMRRFLISVSKNSIRTKDWARSTPYKRSWQDAEKLMEQLPPRWTW